MDLPSSTELEAAVLRRLLEHLRQHTQVQNIDLMTTAHFCRNCLAKWYAEAAAERGVALDYEQARTIVYGMPYPQWKQLHQQEATPEQLALYQQQQQRAADGQR